MIYSLRPPTINNSIVAQLAHGLAVGDEKHGFIGMSREYAAVEFAFGGFIERAAYFVEQQDVATMQQAAGDGYALRLTLTESATALAKF